MHTLKLSLGTVAVVVDELCVLYILKMIVTGGDALFLLVIFAPFLLGILLVATIVATVSFRSARKEMFYTQAPDSSR